MVFNKLRALRRRHARDPQAGVTLIEMMVVAGHHCAL